MPRPFLIPIIYSAFQFHQDNELTVLWGPGTFLRAVLKQPPSNLTKYSWNSCWNGDLWFPFCSALIISATQTRPGLIQFLTPDSQTVSQKGSKEPKRRVIETSN